MFCYFGRNLFVLLKPQWDESFALTIQSGHKGFGRRANRVRLTRRTGRKRGALVTTAVIDRSGTPLISFLGLVHVLLLWSKSLKIVEDPVGMDRLH
jgi:hypothetical protein